jgi:hypothetical protein
MIKKDTKSQVGIYSKKIIVADKDSTGKDEWWCTWFICRNCKKNWLYMEFNYCPNCGKELVWKLK